MIVQYIDHLLGVSGVKSDAEAKRYVFKVAYVLLLVLTRLGYTYRWKKCSLIPSTCVRFLGFLVDFVRQAYILPDDKREKFAVLREF